MAVKPGDDDKTPVWRQVLAGVTALVVLVGAAVAGWEDGEKDEDEGKDEDA